MMMDLLSVLDTFAARQGSGEAGSVSTNLLGHNGTECTDCGSRHSTQHAAGAAKMETE
jgi:hypothetical protein